MAVPGLYCINSTGEAVTLLNECGEGDEQLLREILNHHDFRQWPELWDVLDSWEEDHEQYLSGPERSELRMCYNDIAMVIDYEGRSSEGGSIDE